MPNQLLIMKSYEIVETLRKSRKAVFTPKDIAKKKKPDVIELDANYTDILPFFVLVMNKKEILAEKVRAILTRNRARDIYDLWFLLRKGTRFDLRLVNEKLRYYEKVFEKDVFIERIKGKEDYWQSELKPLVIGKLPRFEAVYKAIREGI
jgi:predicted nucleotidyltransferase component of viral defense system